MRRKKTRWVTMETCAEILGLSISEARSLVTRNRIRSEQVVYGMQGAGVHYETRRETLYDAEAVEQLARLINERGE